MSGVPWDKGVGNRSPGEWGRGGMTTRYSSCPRTEFPGTKPPSCPILLLLLFFPRPLNRFLVEVFLSSRARNPPSVPSSSPFGQFSTLWLPSLQTTASTSSVSLRGGWKGPLRPTLVSFPILSVGVCLLESSVPAFLSVPLTRKRQREPITPTPFLVTRLPSLCPVLFPSPDRPPDVPGLRRVEKPYCDRHTPRRPSEEEV